MAPARDDVGQPRPDPARRRRAGRSSSARRRASTPLAKSDVTLPDTGQPTAAKGYTLIKGAELFTLDTAAPGAPRSRRTATRRSRRRASRRRSSCSRRCGTTRRRTSSSASATGSSSRTTVAARSCRRRRKDELEPGWKTFIGFHNFGKLVNDPLYRTPFLQSSSGRSSSRRSPCSFSFALGLFLAITLDKQGPALPALLPLGARHPVGDPRASSRCSSGPGLLNDDFGDHQPSLPHPRARGCSTRTGRASR